MKEKITKSKREKLMGGIITVRNVFKKHKNYKYEPHTRYIVQWENEQLDNPRAGWVIGFRTVYNGWASPGYDGPSTFHRKEAIKCLLVSFTPTGKLVYVPYDGFSIGGKPDYSHMKWSEDQKKEMRKHPEWWPPNAQRKDMGK